MYELNFDVQQLARLSLGNLSLIEERLVLACTDLKQIPFHFSSSFQLHFI